MLFRSRIYYTGIYQILQFINLSLKFWADHVGSVVSNHFGNKRGQQSNVYNSAGISILMGVVGKSLIELP